ncbi:3-deoxy-8-phosphooctulonate synthase [bacterium]|nr:3-deoxy-8-phosphooctulonate synthase [bacterium]
MENKNYIINGCEYFSGSNDPTIIAGPCVIEDDEMIWKTARKIKELTTQYGFKFIFKSSYDKANRSSIDSFRGPGIASGLKILSEVKKELNVPILVDIHSPGEAEAVAEIADVIQIPAFLCRQTDLLVAAGKTGKIINVKKGQFLSPYEVSSIKKKVESTGNGKCLITERGFSFGYNNLVVDMRSFMIIRDLGIKMVFDGTHSVQLPGGGGNITGGERKFASGLIRAAAAVGVDGIFLEVHPSPDDAKCDAANQVSYELFEKILQQVKSIIKIHG